MHERLPDSAHTLVLSYRAIRRAIGTIGLLLPLVLFVGGLVLGIGIQPTISDYYHTPLGDVLVGALFSLGMFLIVYRGHDAVEAWTANLAAFFAICIALFPLDANSDPLHQRTIAGYLHTLSGGAFFLVLGFYSFHLLPRRCEGGLDTQRCLIYRVSGIVMLLSVVAMGALILFVRGEARETLDRWRALFWLEWIAVWAFAVAWLTKGRTIVTELAAELLAWPMSLLERHGRQ